MTCNPSIAEICEHDPKSVRYTLPSGRVVVESRMCNGATDVSMSDGLEITVDEWREYCRGRLGMKRDE